jgi:uncharacterized protein YeaC (DUF1315 family)
MKFKWLTTLFGDGKTKEIQAVRMWEVRWQSRYDEYSGCVRPEVECFTSEQLAKDFAAALRAAFKLVKITSGNNVTVKSK